MGYFLQALIGQVPSLANKPKAFPSEHHVELAQGIVMIPITEELLEEINDAFPEAQNVLPNEFSTLTDGVIQWARQMSETAPVAYLEAEYFGGVGEQSAVVWNKNKVVLGPTKSAQLGPINKALQFLGVQTVESKDEFDSVGLGQKRNTSDWIVKV